MFPFSQRPVEKIETVVCMLCFHDFLCSGRDPSSVVLCPRCKRGGAVPLYKVILEVGTDPTEIIDRSIVRAERAERERDER